MRQISKTKEVIKLRQDVIIEHLSQNSDIPSLTLAKILVNLHGDLFDTIECARSAIRYMRDAAGEGHTKNNKYKGQFKSPGALAPFAYPKESDQEIKFYQVPLGNTRLGVLSDIHVPKQCNQTLDMALNDFAAKNVNIIILNGDTLDLKEFAKFPYNPNSDSGIGHYFDSVEFFLENLRSAFPNALILFVEGNHDFWYTRWLWMHAKKISNDPYFTLEGRLNMVEYGIKFINQEYIIKMADYYINHGHMITKGGMLDTIAKRVVNKYSSNVIMGHYHYASSFTTYNIENNPVFTCHVTGCCSTTNPSYQPFGGKARKGYLTGEVINGKLEIENVWNDSGKKKLIII